MLHSCRRIPLSTKRRRTSSLWWVVSLPSPLRLFSRWLVCECLLPQCRQVTAACDDILTSSPEALLNHTAQLESVDLVPVSPGDKLVKPTILSLCVCHTVFDVIWICRGLWSFFLLEHETLHFLYIYWTAADSFSSFPWIVTCVILPIPSYFLIFLFPLSFSAWSAPSLPGSSPCRFVPLTSSPIWFKVLHIRSFSLLSLPPLPFLCQCFLISLLQKVHSVQQLCLSSSCASSLCPFYLNSMKEAASSAPISQSIGYFVKVGTLSSPLESSMPFLSINLMLATMHKGSVAGCRSVNAVLC